MSTRNPYRDDVDFFALAKASADFAKVLKENGQLDFSDPKAVQQLTTSLLKRDFQLDVVLPDDRLCPPVPNRLNYILWLQDLLDTTSEDFRDSYDQSRDVVGVDIGTGASCIYPLLGCAQRARWRFIGTDIDDESLQYARRNVALNHLERRVSLLKRTPAQALTPKDFIGEKRLDFTMCNPPFHESTEKMLASAQQKRRPPNSACTGAEIEMVTPGGEVAFVHRMIAESIELKEQVQWYTSMLGKHSSVATIIERLRQVGVHNWAVTEFVQGTKTRRWAVAWSWRDLRPRKDVARNISSVAHHSLPFPSEYCYTVPGASIDRVSAELNATITSLRAAWQWTAAVATGVGFVDGDVWSRAYRRKQKARLQPGRGKTLKGMTTTGNEHDRTRAGGGGGGKPEACSRNEARNEAGNADGDDDEDEDEDEDEDDEVDVQSAALGFKIQLRGEGAVDGTVVVVRWLKGSDAVLFESFCGMIKRKSGDVR